MSALDITSNLVTNFLLKVGNGFDVRGDKSVGADALLNSSIRSAGIFNFGLIQYLTGHLRT